MTTTQIPTRPAPAAATRPRRPRTAWRGWLAFAVVAVITGVCCTSRWGIGADWAAIVRNWRNANGMLADLVQPDYGFFGQTVQPLVETIEIAVIATAAGCAVALPISFVASRVTNPQGWLVRVARLVLSVVRSLPDLVLAVVLVAMVGTGALSGIVSLVIFNVGMVVKLLAETVDAVDTGPLEAAHSAGASTVRAARAAVLPQIMPAYASYSLYTFEVNIRAAAVLGWVGAGGIGQLIQEQRDSLHYHALSLIILEIIVLVLAIDGLSALLRRRLS